MDRIYFSEEWKTSEEYDRQTWYRAYDLMEFLKLVEKENEIMGVILDLESHNIGFILNPKNKE